uniref:hypothetical protein n=1 Tax=Treponema sp. TaxID=166 RepID=UPI00388F5885
MWNYSFVLPDFLILLIFVIYYFIHPRLNSKLNHSFLQVLLADFFVILSDIVASLALENPSHFSPFILRLLNVLYFILFMFRIFSFFIFTEDVIGIRRNKKSPVYILANIIFATFETIALINIFCDTIFSISPSGEYSRTSFYNIIYVCAAFYLILSLGCILHYRKRISRSFKIPVLAFNLVMIAGYISRFAFPRYLIMNLFTLLAIVIIFISYENPIMYLAGKANAFNKKAMFAVFNEIDPKRPPLVLGFVINNYNELREIYSGTQMDKGIQLICQYLAKTYPNLQRFYLHDGRFVLVGGDKAHAEKIKDVLTERFKRAWSAGNEAEL